MADKKRLIYAEDALVGLQYISMYGDVNDTMIQAAMRLARSKIQNAPTVDAVEVVRCKGCKHWHEETGWCDQHSHFIGSDGEACHPWESSAWKMFDADYFCSDGERKAAP